MSITTSGDLIQWHPHGDVLSSDGAFSDDGTFHPLETWDGEVVVKLFRERLLARLIERHAISEEFAHKLLKWRHPGFSAHIGEPIPSEDKKAFEDVASYLVKAPLSLKKLVYLTDPVVTVKNPLIDGGVRIPNFNDDFAGDAPDIGAFELGRPPLRFGRRAMDTPWAPWELDR